jgi:hypothetical protein
VRELADAGRVRRFMTALGQASREETTCYLTGGGTAVLVGWRETTVDVDILLEPESDELLRGLAALKNELQINVELASPADFIPLPEGWRDRSPFVAKEGKVVFRHFDPLSQALAKLERDHERDRLDVEALVEAGLVDRLRLCDAFDEIEPQLYRFPAIDPERFRGRVEEATR